MVKISETGGSTSENAHGKTNISTNKIPNTSQSKDKHKQEDDDEPHLIPVLSLEKMVQYQTEKDSDETKKSKGKKEGKELHVSIASHKTRTQEVPKKTKKETFVENREPVVLPFPSKTVISPLKDGIVTIPISPTSKVLPRLPSEELSVTSTGSAGLIVETLKSALVGPVKDFDVIYDKSVKKEKPKKKKKSKKLRKETVEEGEMFPNIHKDEEGEEGRASGAGDGVKMFRRRKVPKVDASAQCLSETSIEEKTEPPKARNIFVQKFERGDEEEEMRKPKRKEILRGSFKSHSFTNLKQKTIRKPFYYGLLLGTIHQGHEHFQENTRNQQDLCMPIAAFCYAALEHPNFWRQTTIDDILEAGDKMYLDIFEAKHWHDLDKAPDISPSDLSNVCTFDMKKVAFIIDEPFVSGMVRSEDKRVYNLTKGLNVFFESRTSGLLQMKGINITLWRDKFYYFFEALPRNTNLYRDEKGFAALALFYNLKEIISVLLDRTDLENMEFVIRPIVLKKVLELEEEYMPEPKPSNKGDMELSRHYIRPTEQKYVLLGSYDLGDRCFGVARNKQALTMAVVALVYTKISPPLDWDRENLDKIMVIGNQLYFNCVKDDQNLEITLEDIAAVFTIGPYVVEIFIQQKIASGLLYNKGNWELLTAIKDFFMKNTMGIVDVVQCAVAIWRQRGMFFCFDPYPRGVTGSFCPTGVACVTVHSSVRSLTRTITENFDKDISPVFYIHALKVCKIRRDKSQNDILHANKMMKDYTIDQIKNKCMKVSNRCATYKEIAVNDKTKVTETFMDELKSSTSIVIIDSNVVSLKSSEVPSILAKNISIHKPLNKLKTSQVIIDLDSPALSETQIEPPKIVHPEEEQEIKYMDLDAYDLTQEEKELQGGAEEEEGLGEAEEGSSDESSKESEKAANEETRQGEEFGEDEEMEGEDWYAAIADYSSFGSASLRMCSTKISKQINTEITCVPLRKVVLPAERNVEDIPKTISQLLIEKPNKVAQQTIKFMASPKKATKNSLENSKNITKTPEDKLKQSNEWEKENNFVDVIDGSQIILGMANAGQDVLDAAAGCICFQSLIVSHRYSLRTWNQEIIAVILKTGIEMHEEKLLPWDQIDGLNLGEIQVNDMFFYASIKKISNNEQFLSKMAHSDSMHDAIIVTPTYCCAVMFRNFVYYVFDPYENDEWGFGTGQKNNGCPCLLRFKSAKHAGTRINFNKFKRDQLRKNKDNRLIIFVCKLVRVRKPSEELTFGEKVESAASYICLQSLVVSHRFPLPAWNQGIIDDVLRKGLELHRTLNLSLDKTTDLNLQVPIRDTLFRIKATYYADNSVDVEHLEHCFSKMVVTNNIHDSILITSSYCCAIMIRDTEYYIFDPYENEVAAFGADQPKTKFASLLPFGSLEEMASHIVVSKMKKDRIKMKKDKTKQPMPNKFIIFSCKIESLGAAIVKTGDKSPDGKLMDDGEDTAAEKTEAPMKPGDVLKIEGTTGIVFPDGEQVTTNLNVDYFVCLAVTLGAIIVPLKQWTGERIDKLVKLGLEIASNVPKHPIQDEFRVHKIHIDQYFINIISQAKHPEMEKLFQQKNINVVLQTLNGACFVVSQLNEDASSYQLFTPYQASNLSKNACWMRLSYDALVNAIQSQFQDIAYHHVIRVTHVEKMPKTKSKHSKSETSKSLQKVGADLNEDLNWLDVDPYVWTPRCKKTKKLLTESWFMEAEGTFSLFASKEAGEQVPVLRITPTESRGEFPAIFGLYIFVLAMTSVFTQEKWNQSAMDYFIKHGLDFANKNVGNWRDVESISKVVKHGKFTIHFTFEALPSVGITFLPEPTGLNLNRFLRQFFFEKGANKGIAMTIGPNPRALVFGRNSEYEYFVYDAQTRGAPIFPDNEGVPYAYRVITLNRLIVIMAVVLREGKFGLFEFKTTSVERSEQSNGTERLEEGTKEEEDHMMLQE